MYSDNFSEKIIKLYQYIQNEFNKKRKVFIEEGYLSKERINFEYIDLDNIFDELIDMIPSILDFYKDGRFRHIKREIYCVFIASLCEVSKRGFSQGGILKQIDEYIGFEFNRNRYYQLIKEALKSEKIKVFENTGHPYEATIVYESGIPKKLHKDLYKLFKFYWKWMRGIDSEERRDFLRAFIEKQVVYEEYIFDKNDYIKMCTLRDSMIDFQEKVIKTCIRIDKIYTEIDKIQIEVNEYSINEICKKLSEYLGYNILTVINEDALKRDLIKYAHCISFNVFQKIIDNLSSVEKIQIPTGQNISSGMYSKSNFLCGYHMVRQVKYEVIFPYGLKCKDYYELPRDKVIKRNEHYIYTSECHFQVEIDGYSVNIRELIWNNETLYIYAGKIPKASCAYIDGNIINCDEDVKLQASIRKSWDYVDKKNKLILCIDEVKIFNPKYAMQSVEISCNISSKTIIRSINQRGHLRISEKWVEIENLTEIIEVFLKVNGEIILSKRINVLPLYVYSLQTGYRIQNLLEWKDWHSDNRIVIFSKHLINFTNIELTYQDMFYNMYVYLGNFDFSENNIKLNETIIEIVKSDIPMIKLSSEVNSYSNCLCIPFDAPIKFSALNCSDEGLFLKISHGEEHYKGKPLKELSDLNNIYLSECGVDCSNNYGKWNVSLYQEQKKVCNISFFVLAKIDVQLSKEIYCERDKVIAQLKANNKCFYFDGEITDTYDIEIGNAKLCINGNHVGSEIIEFEVIDANCNVQYQLRAIPEVWGLHTKVNDDWVEALGTTIKLKLDSKENIALILCSTKGQNVFIRSQDMDTKLYINPGFNHISWRFLKYLWKRINDFVICNYLGDQAVFQINYEPNIYCKESYFTSNISKITFNYIGPIGTKITLIAYINDSKVAKLIKTSIRSRFEMDLNIDNISNYNFGTLVVSGRIDEEDAFEVHQEIINYEEKKETIIERERNNVQVELSKYLRTKDLLQVKSKKFSKKHSTLEILKYYEEI